MIGKSSGEGKKQLANLGYPTIFQVKYYKYNESKKAVEDREFSKLLEEYNAQVKKVSLRFLSGTFFTGEIQYAVPTIYRGYELVDKIMEFMWNLNANQKEDKEFLGYFIIEITMGYLELDKTIKVWATAVYPKPGISPDSFDITMQLFPLNVRMSEKISVEIQKSGNLGEKWKSIIKYLKDKLIIEKILSEDDSGREKEDEGILDKIAGKLKYNIKPDKIQKDNIIKFEFEAKSLLSIIKLDSGVWGNYLQYFEVKPEEIEKEMKNYSFQIKEGRHLLISSNTRKISFGTTFGISYPVGVYTKGPLTEGKVVIDKTNYKPVKPFYVLPVLSFDVEILPVFKGWPKVEINYLEDGTIEYKGEEQQSPVGKSIPSPGLGAKSEEYKKVITYSPPAFTFNLETVGWPETGGYFRLIGGSKYITFHPSPPWDKGGILSKGVPGFHGISEIISITHDYAIGSMWKTSIKAVLKQYKDPEEKTFAIKQEEEKKII